MGVSPGSWWVNPKTKQRMVVATWFRQSKAKSSSRLYVKNSHGRSSDRVPCHLEGYGLYLAWLTEDEIRGGWEPYRPLKDTSHIPQWLQDVLDNKPNTFKDVLFNDIGFSWDDVYSDKEKARSLTTNAICNVKYGWVSLTAVTPFAAQDADHTVQTAKIRMSHRTDSKIEFASHDSFNWGLQQYTTHFMPMKEAVKKLRPRFNGRGLTALDRLVLNNDDDF